MKKKYITPEIDITKFGVQDVLLSGNIDPGNEVTNAWEVSEPESPTRPEDLPFNF